MRLETSEGDIVLEARRAWAPLGADRFYNLVKHGFYDSARFYRVLPRFAAQAGTHADPAISAVWREQTIADDPVKESNLKGTVTFANSGPGTRTTQIFINLDNNSYLDESGFAPFARIIEGMDAAERLYAGYGEMAPDGKGPDYQRLELEGNAYLEKEFPELDYIVRAVLVPAGAAP